MNCWSFFAVRRTSLVVIALALGAAGAGCADSEGDGGDGGGGGADPGAADACEAQGVLEACELPGDTPGAPTSGRQCVADANGDLAWSACVVASSAASTPLVLSFDGARVEFSAGERPFDINGTTSVVTDWPAATTPWLALDRNGNGTIDDGSELFGSGTQLRDGQHAENGFVALAQLDSNGDGRVTADDAMWSSLSIWRDRDADRLSSSEELAGLGARRILSIDLGYRSERACDARGNCEIERSTFRWADDAGVEHTGAIVDVHLKHQ